MGPGSPLAVARVGRDDNRFSLEHQPAAAGNDCRLGVPCFRPVLYREWRNSNVSSRQRAGDSDHALGCVGPRGAGSTTYDNQPAGALRPTMPGGKSAVTIRPGALPPDPNELWRPSLSHPRSAKKAPGGLPRRGSSAQVVTRASRNDVAVDADAKSVVVLILDRVEGGRLGRIGRPGHLGPGRCRLHFLVDHIEAHVEPRCEVVLGAGAEL